MFLHVNAASVDVNKLFASNTHSLSDNHIGSEGAVSLAKGLQHCTELQALM